MNSVTPVTVVGGYLGAGKTTLVNHLLRHAGGRRLAIMVNDFGKLPIDADLIEADDGDVISLSGGCICCSYGNDLAAALVTMQQTVRQPDHIVIEASGVALPRGIVGTVSLLPALRMDNTIVLIDSSSIMQLHQDNYLADTIVRQLEDAQLVLLNKFDLLSEVDQRSVEAWLEKTYPNARWLATTHAAAPVDILLDSAVGKTIHTHSNNSHDRRSHEHHIAGFESVELCIAQPVDCQTVAKQLADPRAGLLRVKGFVTDTSGKLKTIQVVGNRWLVSAAPPEVQPGLVCIGKTGAFSLKSLQEWCGLSPDQMNVVVDETA